MTRRIRWGEKAALDYLEQLEFVANDSPVNAELVDNRINAALELLAKRPIGRAGRVAGTYEKSISGPSLIVAYMLEDETLHIVRVIHMKRQWPKGEWPEE